MEKNLSYSELYYTLSSLYNQLQQEQYPSIYLNALKDTQRVLLFLELLNIAYSSKFN